MNKKKALHLMTEFGDAILEFNDGRKPILATTDFSNKYIKSIRRTEKFALRGNILMFNWTNNMFAAVPTHVIRNITPLTSILRNVRDGS